MARQSDGRSVLSRHLAVLGAFDVDAPFLTASQIARRSGLPLSSAHRLVGELEAHGILERLADGTFRIGLRLWELASRTPGALGLRETALPHMQEVHALVGQHTQLGVLQDRDVLFLERLSTRDAVVNVTLVGGRLPLHASSSGLVLLAHGPLELQEAVLASPLRRITAATVHDPGALRAMLAAVRRTGAAVGRGFLHPEAMGIAVPVVGPGGAVVAALGVVVPNDDSSVDGRVAVLRSAAARITESLTAAYLPVSEPGAEPGGRYRPLVHSSRRSMEYLASGRARA